MSCIATGHILKTTDMKKALSHIGNIKTVETGWWIFKRKVVVGEIEFVAFWDSINKTSFDFDYSGFAFCDAEIIFEEQTGKKLMEFCDSNAVKTLEKGFGYGGYIFYEKLVLPKISKSSVEKYCRDTHGEDYEIMTEAVMAAYEFIESGVDKIAQDNCYFIELG